MNKTEIICSSFDEYLEKVTEQVVAHGNINLKAFRDVKALLLGFSSPSGNFLISINKIRKAATDEFIKRSGQIPEIEIVFPPKNILDDFILSFQKNNTIIAIAEGERIRNEKQ